MKWLKPKPSKQAIVLLAAIVVGGAAATAGTFVQRRTALAQATVVLESKLAQRDEGTRLASRLALKQELLRTDRTRLKFLETGVPERAYVPTMLRQLEFLARSTDNTVRGVRPVAEQATPPTKKERRTDPEADEKAAKAVPDAAAQKALEPYNRLRIQVNLTGSYNGAQKFLHELTRFPKVIAVNGIILRPRSEGEVGGKALLDIELNLTAFVMKDGSGLPIAPPPSGAHPSGGGAEEV